MPGAAAEIVFDRVTKRYPGRAAAADELSLTIPAGEICWSTPRETKLAGDMRLVDTVNAVSAKLTLDAMKQMNKAVAIDKQQPAAVAKQFLQANGLL